MGDRASVSFKTGDEESVALFSHWGGMAFVKTAEEYAARLQKSRSGQTYPLDRFEPSVVMVDFIRYITAGKGIITNDLYLGKDGDDGDNSDNGHHVIEFKKAAGLKSPLG